MKNCNLLGFSADFQNKSTKKTKIRFFKICFFLINCNFSPLGKSNALLNPFSVVMFWKNDIWENKKTTLNSHMWKTKTNLESRPTISESSFNFLQQRCCPRVLSMWLHDRRVHLPQPLSLLPATCSANRVQRCLKEIYFKNIL